MAVIDPISPLPPTAPSRLAPAFFRERMDAFLAWIVTFVASLNTMAGQFNAAVADLAAGVTPVGTAGATGVALLATATAAAARTVLEVTGGEYAGINTQTASYTLVLADKGKLVVMEHASNAMNLTVPPESSVAFPVGTWIDGLQSLAGEPTIVPGAGVTVSSLGPALKGVGAGAFWTLVKRTSNVWWASGALKP